jgi:hypothetical protein
MKANRNIYRTLAGMPKRMRPLRNLDVPRLYMDIIKMDLSKIRWGGMDWINMAVDWDQW